MPMLVYVLPWVYRLGRGMGWMSGMGKVHTGSIVVTGWAVQSGGGPLLGLLWDTELTLLSTLESRLASTLGVGLECRRGLRRRSLGLE